TMKMPTAASGRRNEPASATPAVKPNPARRSSAWKWGWNAGSNGSLTSYASSTPSQRRGPARHGWCSTGTRVASATAVRVATATRTSRCQPRGATAGTTARTSNAKASQPSCFGCSSRSQLSNSTTPGTRLISGTRSLAMRSLHERRRTEDARQVVALPEHGHRDARRLEAQERRLSVANAIHVDERGVAPRLRALDEAVDEPALEPRRDDDEVEREGRRIALAREQVPRRLGSVGLGAGEQLERAPPVAFRLDTLHLHARAAEDERRAPAPARV